LDFFARCASVSRLFIVFLAPPPRILGVSYIKEEKAEAEEERSGAYKAGEKRNERETAEI